MCGGASPSPCVQTWVALLQRFSVKLVDYDSGETVWCFNCELSSEFRCVAFSPDGQLLATGHSDGEVRLWEPNSRSYVGSVHGRRLRCSQPCSQLLASGSEDGS